MPINRESQITVLRSIGGSIPDGLTFGEFGFAGANRQLFIGGTGGGASVESIWIGASITGTDIVGINGSGIWPNGYDSQYTLSTTKAVKKYIDDAVGTAGVVTSVNGNIGAITITGAGNNAAVVVRQGVLNGPHNIDARLATASLTGVASFNPQYFTVGANGAVTLNQGTTFTVRGSDGSSDVIGLTGTLTLTGSGALRINAGTYDGGNDATVTFDPRIATASLTGVASFPASFFTVSTTGAVNLASNYQVTGDTVVAGNSISVTRSNNQLTVNNTGVTGIGFGIDSGLVGKINVTGAGGAGGSQVITVAGNQVTFDNRIATASLTGVASFSPGQFTVGTTGNVVLGAAYQVTGHTVLSGGASQLVSTVNNVTSIDNRIATTTGITGVASFSAGQFIVGTTGNVALAAAYQVTGHTVVSVGSSQVADTVGNTTRIDNKLATIGGQTGVASFSNNFQISPVGQVDLANNVTIAGTLTVQGEVVTANVSNFTVEDTLIKLGTGNNTFGTAYDLGFYMQYPQAANNIRLAGFFLDYDDTKFKLFTGLTAGAQDGTTGTDQAAKLHSDRQGYTVATLVAKLDGGTF
jgi:hypothetical protein